MTVRWYGKERLPDKDSFNELEPGVWAKTTTTLMWGPTEGPLILYTKDAPVRLSHEWRGYIALDADGFPYPVDIDLHARTYRPVTDPREIPVEQMDYIRVYEENKNRPEEEG